VYVASFIGGTVKGVTHLFEYLRICNENINRLNRIKIGLQIKKKMIWALAYCWPPLIIVIAIRARSNLFDKCRWEIIELKIGIQNCGFLL